MSAKICMALGKLIHRVECDGEDVDDALHNVSLRENLNGEEQQTVKRLFATHQLMQEAVDG